MKGGILDLVSGTKDWYNIKYEDVLSLNILLEIERGDLKFVK